MITKDIRIFNLSLQHPVPGCKFGGFVQILDKYPDKMKTKLLTNNNNHDAVETLTGVGLVSVKYKEGGKEYKGCNHYSFRENAANQPVSCPVR